MATTPNPYQTPLEGELDKGGHDPFPTWTTGKMVALFFLPSLGMILCVAVGIYASPLVMVAGFIACGCGALAMTGFSAHVHQRRQNAGLGTFLLMVLVYLIAQIFALFLTIALIAVILEKLGLWIH